MLLKKAWEIYIGLISMKRRKKCSSLNTFANHLLAHRVLKNFGASAPKIVYTNLGKFFLTKLRLLNSQRMSFYQLFVYIKLFIKLLPIDPSRLVRFVLAHPFSKFIPFDIVMR